MKKVFIIGLGIGNLDYMHPKALETIKSCDCLVGAKECLRFPGYEQGNLRKFKSRENLRIYKLGNTKPTGFWFQGIAVSTACLKVLPEC